MILRFDETYNAAMETFEEGIFKSLAAAGLLGAANMYASPTQSQQPPITATSSDARIINNILEFTKMAEASGVAKLKAYKCPTGHLTIGYGTNLEEPHNKAKLKAMGYNTANLRGLTISKKDADVLLQFGLQQALKDARTFLPNFDQQPSEVQGAVLYMSYNMGLNTLSQFKKFRAALMKSNYKSAKAEMINSTWYKQVGNDVKSLVNTVGKAQKTPAG